jgi:4-hydroxy-2-oxoheptanedioate aldolase
MTRTDRYRERLADGGRPTAGMCTGPDLLIAEAFAQNFDAVIVDLQHGSAGIDRLHALALAVERHGAAVFVRVSWNQPAEIMRALDLGATGIIVPMVETADEAAAAASAMRYPPLGVRSFGPMRPGSLPAAEANAFVQLFPLVETVAGMTHIDEILDVDGVDGVYVGVGDLAISMGLGPGASYRSDEVRAAIETAVAAAHARGKLLVTSAPDRAFADGLYEIGVDVVIVGLDKALLYDGIRGLAASPSTAQ